jgi:hypothetical protein
VLRLVQLLAAGVATVLLMAACQAVPPPLAFEHSTRLGVHRIGLPPLGLPEHAEVSIMNPIGAGFGVVGNLIESRRAANANEEMAAILAKAHYDFGAALGSAVAGAMHKAGFTISRIDSPRSSKERGRFLSNYPQRPQVDAYLDVYARYVGFQALQSSVDYRPRIEIVARLVAAKGGTTLFQNRIVYGQAVSEDEDARLVRADDSVSFRDRAALQTNPATTAHALQTAIEAVAWELATQFM